MRDTPLVPLIAPTDIERRACRRSPRLRNQRLRDFVARVFREVDVVHPRDLRKAFATGYGVTLPAMAVHNALQPLLGEGRIVRVGKGLYARREVAGCPAAMLRFTDPLAAKMLGVLVEFERAVPAYKLAARTGIRPTLLYRPLRVLEKKGWARRYREQGQTFFRATLAGQQAYKDAQLLDLFT